MSLRRLSAALLIGVWLASGCGEDPEPSAAAGDGEPALERIGDFESPVFLAQAPGSDDLYVVEREGTVRVLSPDGEISAEPFLDVRADVTTEGEGGLFSLAFAPGYERSGRLYVDYASRHRDERVVEYRADPSTGRVDPRSRTVVLAIPHPNFIHWGGLLVFGPGDRLYLGTGDGGPPFPIPDTAQDPESLLGKILRVDPRTGEAEVVVTGVRNPWRYSFDPETGDLWIGDVGDFTQEEVDRLDARRVDGANLGWPDLEGTAQTKSDIKAPGAIPPLLTYERTGKPDDPVCAVTGGYVVRDPALASLAGRYLYGDFCKGKVLSVGAAAAHPAPRPTGLEVPQLVSFAEDLDRRLYAISLDGPVYRLVER